MGRRKVGARCVTRVSRETGTDLFSDARKNGSVPVSVFRRLLGRRQQELIEAEIEPPADQQPGDDAVLDRGVEILLDELGDPAAWTRWDAVLS